MEIDIDSFLDKQEQNEITKNEKEKKIQDKNIDLSFQKEVEDKLNTVEKKTKNSEFDFLKKAYIEVRKFDEDLGTRFLGIEEKGNEVLEFLGEKYSTEFLASLMKRIEHTQNNIRNILSIVKNKSDENNFTQAFQGIERAMQEVNVIPNQFFEKKIELIEEIKKTEIILNKKFKDYKEEKIKEFKSLTKSKIIELNKTLIPRNLEIIKSEIEKLEYFNSSIPKFFLSELVEEKNMISNTLINAWSYLLKQEYSEFNIKKSIIENLMEKFHKIKIEKKIDDLLIIYNEMILEFQKMPEIFFEEKVKIFRQINGLYSSINNLVIKNNLSTFYEAYNYSKTLEEVRDYIEHIYETKKINKDTLLEMGKKLKDLPSKYDLEKEELSKQLDALLEICNKKMQPSNKNYGDVSKPQIEIQNPKEPKTDENKEKIEFKFEKENINPNMKAEIQLYIKKLIDSNDAQELKIYYNKLIFYLGLTKLDESKKKVIISNLRKIILSKKLSKK